MALGIVTAQLRTKMTDRTEQRTLENVEFLHPETVLMKLGPLQRELTASNADERLRSLRTNKLKSDREMWHGSLLVYAWSKIWGKELLYAYHENQDYDIIVRSDTDRALIKVQLKELPPKTLNPRITLQGLVDKCRSNKNYDLKGTTVAILVNNEDGRLETEDIPSLGDPDIWLFGFAAPNQTQIFAAGHIGGQSAFWVVDHPFFARIGNV